MKHFSYNFSPGPTKIPQVNESKGEGNNVWDILSTPENYQSSSDATLFSSSLPVLPHEKLNANDIGDGRQSLNYEMPTIDKIPQDVGDNDFLESVEINGIGNLLPGDEDELLAGIMEDFDLSKLPSSLEDLEDYDVFASGGIELENDPQEILRVDFSKLNLSDAAMSNGMLPFSFANGVGTVSGEHPFGEHPSRTLFVRNINSNVEDSELRELFEQYGDIRNMYTTCKHRGFVMISYYDIRAARTAMHALQNKPLRRRKLDIHFSIPKDNPSDKDMNQGTLVAFNLDPSVPIEEVRKIFGAYGEIKEIRETPHKRHHKFIEFYDVRASEAALKALNRCEIAGKRIKLEPSRPGGTRRNMMLHLNQEIDPDESRSSRNPVGSPITNSPPGNWAQFNSPIEPSALQSIGSPVFRNTSPTSNNFPGLASMMQQQGSNPVKVPPIGKEIGRSRVLDHPFADIKSTHGSTFQQSHSLPESKLSQFHGSTSSPGPSISNGSSLETLSGPQFLWGSPKPYSEHTTSSTAWPTPAAGHSSIGKGHGFSYSGGGPYLGSSKHLYHVGSAPSGVPFERHLGFVSKAPDTSFISGVLFRSSSLSHNGGNFMMNMGAHAPRNAGIPIQRNMPENGSTGYRMMSSPRLSPVLLSSGPSPGLTPNSFDGFIDRGRSRRFDGNEIQVDNKKQFQLDLEKIKTGEDTRTTLMIKNIPNKYTSKMLLAAIDEHNKGTYDFLYLPIDFKNKCNVGYAFINMLSSSHIIPFYEAFNGKRWEKFNSEKVASLAYARIQGKAALVSHFQNSSLMNEDKRCRPIVFHSEGHDAGDQTVQERLTSSHLNIHFHQLDGLHLGDTPGSLTKDGSGEQSDVDKQP